MSKLPSWALYVIAAVLVVFSLPGIIFASHAIAKVVYAVLIVVAGMIVVSTRKRGAVRS